MQLQILQLAGTETQLYKLVAPLVMDPNVLRLNNNYPFKTTDKFTWFIALQRKRVVGFIPVEQRNKTAIINNYYVEDSSDEILEQLITKAIVALNKKSTLSAIVQVKHQSVFEKCGFTIETIWKLYVKMQKEE